MFATSDINYLFTFSYEDDSSEKQENKDLKTNQEFTVLHKSTYSCRIKCDNQVKSVIFLKRGDNTEPKG